MDCELPQTDSLLSSNRCYPAKSSAHCGERDKEESDWLQPSTPPLNLVLSGSIDGFPDVHDPPHTSSPDPPDYHLEGNIDPPHLAEDNIAPPHWEDFIIRYD